ncbi:MAG: thioredoxin family protein [Candidatus Eisenbacteria bacterium]
MKPILLSGAALLAASIILVSGMPAGAEESAPAALALGSKAPMADVQMKTAAGSEVSIAGVKGAKGTLVVFTCNGCPWAKKWEARIVKLGNEASKKGIGVVAINANDPSVNATDDYANMVTRAKDRGMKFPYAMDATSDIARAFGATRTPEAFLFDGKGLLVYHGTIDDNADDAGAVKQPYLANAVWAVAGGKAVPVAETKSLGCGIKFRAAKTAS